MPSVKLPVKKAHETHKEHKAQKKQKAKSLGQTQQPNNQGAQSQMPTVTGSQPNANSICLKQMWRPKGLGEGQRSRLGGS